MELEFERFYKLSMVCLRLNGAHPAVPRNWKWALHFCLMHGYYTLYATFFGINLIFFDTKTSNACLNGILLMIYITVTFQYVVMVWHQQHIKTIIKYQQNFFVSTRHVSVEDQKIVEYYATRGRWSSKLWFGSTCFALIMYPVTGIIQTFLYFYQNREFKLYPIDENTYPSGIEELKFRIDVFILLYCLRLFHGCYNVIMYTGFAALGPIFITNTCGQVEMAIKQTSHLIAGEDYDRESTNNAIKNLVRDIHQVYSCISTINKVFEVFYELCLKATAFVSPVALIVLTWIWKHTGVWSMDYIMYALGPFMLCFEICYYCDILMEKGEELRQAIYACGWENQFDSSLRKNLIIMLTRNMRPMTIKTPFRTLCLDTFAQMCFQSYSIFNVLNAVLK